MDVKISILDVIPNRAAWPLAVACSLMAVGAALSARGDQSPNAPSDLSQGSSKALDPVAEFDREARGPMPMLPSSWTREIRTPAI